MIKPSIGDLVALVITLSALMFLFFVTAEKHLAEDAKINQEITSHD